GALWNLGSSGFPRLGRSQCGQARPDRVAEVSIFFLAAAPLVGIRQALPNLIGGAAAGKKEGCAPAVRPSLTALRGAQPRGSRRISSASRGEQASSAEARATRSIQDTEFHYPKRTGDSFTPFPT